MNRFSKTVCYIFLAMAVAGASARRSANVNVAPASGTYGGSTSLQATLGSGKSALPNKTITFSLNGIAVGSADTNSKGVATLNNVSLAGINANTYAQGIRATFAGDATYQGSEDTARLTVNKAPAVVTPNSATKSFGSPDPVLTGTLSGFLASDNVVATYSRTMGESVEGSPYTISATLSPAGVLSNYAIVYNTASFTITSVSTVPLTVTANDATRLQGTANPPFTARYTGFVDGDTESSLGGTLSFATNATQSSPVGAYTITPSGLTSSKYTITFVSGTLNVRYAYVTNNNILTPSDYQTFQPPAPGASYTATSGFYTPIKRLTDSMHTIDDAGGSTFVVTMGTEYSTMSPFNQDNTRLVLNHRSYFGLYDGSGNFLRNLPFEITASSEPRWSRSDPNVLYYVRANQLKQYNVGSGTASVVRTFSEYSTISGMGESDISFDGRHFVFAGDRRYVFVYDFFANTKGPVLDTAGRGFDSIYVTPDNNVTITWLTNGNGTRFTGIELFDSNMNFLRQLAHSGGHQDVTRDANGDEIMVWASGGDPWPQTSCYPGIVKIRLADASQTCLAILNWTVATHISATDNSGWVFVETYAPSDPIPPSGWNTYTNELMQIKLDGSQVRRLAHHRSRPFSGNTYTYQPKLSISRDGRKLAYASNFGLQHILGNPTNYSDAYVIDISVISPDTLGTAAQ